MKRLLWFYVALALSICPVMAQVSRTLSLPEAVDAAVHNQPLMRSADLRVTLAEKRIGEARTGFLPTIQLSETVIRGNNPVFVFGSLLEQGRFAPQNFSFTALNNPAAVTNVRNAVSANVPVFDGMKTSFHVAEAKIGRDQAVLQRGFAEQRVRFDVLRQYFAVLVAQADADVAAEAVRTAEADLTRTKDRLDAGLAVESDRLAAQVQLAEFMQQQIDAEGKLATAFAALNISTGSAPQARYKLTNALVKKPFSLARLDELTDRAILHRPDYAQARSGIEFSERRLSEKKGEYLPAVNVFGTFGASGPNWGSGSTDYTVGASLTFDLLDPGRASRIGQARIERSLAESERDRLRDQIVVEVTGAYHSYRSAVQQLEVAEGTLSQAAEALRIIQDRYEAGLTTITDLLRAETASVRARMNVTAAIQGQYVGYANLLLSIGELNDVRVFEASAD